MIIEKTVLIDKWLLINADDKASWKYLFLIEGKLHSLSEAEELYNQFKNQRERLNPEDTWIKTAIIDELFDDNGNLKSICDSPNIANK